MHQKLLKQQSTSLHVIKNTYNSCLNGVGDKWRDQKGTHKLALNKAKLKSKKTFLHEYIDKYFLHGPVKYSHHDEKVIVLRTENFSRLNYIIIIIANNIFTRCDFTQRIVMYNCLFTLLTPQIHAFICINSIHYCYDMCNHNWNNSLLPCKESRLMVLNHWEY